jgi:hypothetical protein
VVDERRCVDGSTQALMVSSTHWARALVGGPEEEEGHGDQERGGFKHLGDHDQIETTRWARVLGHKQGHDAGP